MKIVAQTECAYIKIPPSSPVKPLVDNCSQYISHETTDNCSSDSGTSKIKSSSDNHGSHNDSRSASDSTSDSSTLARKAESDKKRGESQNNKKHK